MTAAEVQPPVSEPPSSPQDLLRQLDTARQALEAQLDALRTADVTHVHGDIADNASARLLRLSLLRDQLVGGANGISPAALRADIAAAIASTLAYTSQISTVAAGTQGSSPEQAAQIALQQASAASRQMVSDFARDFYERKIFDPYLRFSSAADEEAYRQREVERQREIERARAENTPEGNLRADRLALAQLDDAGAHGADRSPDFSRWHRELRAGTTRLSGAIDSGRHRAEAAAHSEERDGTKPDAKVSPDVLAALRDAGVTVADQSGTGHGVTVKGKSADRTVLPG